MPSTGFGDAIHKLDAATINRTVTKTSPGAYALTDHDTTKGVFVVDYVGRSDVDLKTRLLQHAAKGEYSHFKARYYPSPKAAFDKECDLYHDFGESNALDNAIHPQRPANSGWKCPRCAVFG
jgi:hypothetical protein